jgi:hypothetical protein
MDLTNMREELKQCLSAYVSMIKTYNSLLEKICFPEISDKRVDS